LIAKAPENGKRGTNTYGLLRYLFGRGRANEHTNQRLIAAWDPEWLDGGVFGQRHRGWLATLGREIDAAMTGHAVRVPGGHIYHVVLSVPAQDGTLGDATWRELVEEAITHMGFDPDNEGHGGCRWVAVHHGPSKEGNDHVHLVVNLVRGDGRIADTYRDWPRWRQWCLTVENRLGLTPTSPANRTAPRRPTRAETEKTARLGRSQTSREYLRKVVRIAATRANNAEEFVTLLEREPLVVLATRRDSDGQLTGYRVALLGDRSNSSSDQTVWFGGSQLARDLSAPKLMQRWASAPATPPPLTGDKYDRHAATSRAERHASVNDAKMVADHARHTLAAVITNHAAKDHIDNTRMGLSDADRADGIAHATLDLMVATAKAVEGHDGGPLTQAALRYEQAAATPYQVQPARWAPVAAELRTAARRLSRVGALSRRGSTATAVAALIVSLAALVTEIAAWRELTGQLRQAAAAREAAAMLPAPSDASSHTSEVRPPRPRPTTRNQLVVPRWIAAPPQPRGRNRHR